MSHQAVHGRVVETAPVSHVPAFRAYQILHWMFAGLPVLAGIDKFTGLLTDWTKYVSLPVARAIDPRLLMSVAGVVEIGAGLLVAFRPRIGAYVVAAWLGAVVINLLVLGSFYYDVAVRDACLALGALALGNLAREFDRPPRHAA
jgi:hypothetical protein